MLGAAAVAQSPADGYTFLLGTGSTHGTNSAVYSKLTYDPVRDFDPVVLVTQSPLMMVVPPTSPAKTVKEFIALAQSKPGKLTFGSYGTGSINHLGAELFNSMAHIQTNHIPYRGSAPALTDLVGGRLDFVFDGVSTSLGYVEGGTLRLLGIAGLKPHAGPARCADDFRGRRSGIRHVGVVRPVCASRDAQGGHRTDQQEDERGARFAAGEG